MATNLVHDAMTPGAPESARFDNFSCIVERYQSLVWAVAYAATGDAALSEDVVQETFLAAWKQQADVRDLSKIRGYLTSIARNQALKACRRTGREVADDGEQAQHVSEDLPSPLDDILLREQLSQVERALGAIPPASREPFVLFYLEGKSVGRVAVDLDLSQSAVKQRLFRARECLKENVAAQLARALVESRPGKAAIATTMALIASQIAPAPAAAAASAAVGSTPSLPATGGLPPEAASGAVGTGVAAVASKLLVLTGAVVVASLLHLLASDLEASGSRRVSAIPQALELEKATPEDSPAVHAMPAKRLESEAQNTAWQVEGAADQPLVAGRILQDVDGADRNADGVLSQDELEATRESQEEKLISLVIANWQNEGMEIHCHEVGWDGIGVYETRSAYVPGGYREQYEDERSEGLDLNAREWVASQFASQSRQGRICHKVYSEFEDRVRELTARSEDGVLHWRASTTHEDGGRTMFAPPDELREELAGVVDEDGLEEVAGKWKVRLYAIDDNIYHQVSGEPDSFLAIEDHHPAIRKAVE